MYEVLKPSIYNDFFKEERKKRKLTLQDLSKQIHYSIGLISAFENDPDILNNDKLSIFLLFYGYDIDYLHNFDEQLTALVNNYTHNILYSYKDLIIKSYENLSNFFNQYNDNILFLGIKLFRFIYNIFLYRMNEATVDLSDVKNMDIFSKHIEAIKNIYLGRYYMTILQYQAAIPYLTNHIFTEITDLNIIGFRNISLSTSYMRTKKIALAIQYCNEAISCYTATNNYIRLLNTNIDKGNQLLKIKDYQGALEVNNQALKSIGDDYLPEKRTFLHNNAFIYMMQNKYDKAVKCYEIMPISEMRVLHWYSYMICLVEVGDTKKAKEIWLEWKDCSDPYCHRIFEIYGAYFEHNSLVKLNSDTINLLKKFRNTLDAFDIEFLHVLIAHHYKKLNMYKKSMEYLEKLRELDF